MVNPVNTLKTTKRQSLTIGLRLLDSLDLEPLNVRGKTASFARGDVAEIAYKLDDEQDYRYITAESEDVEIQALLSSLAKQDPVVKENFNELLTLLLEVRDGMQSPSMRLQNEWTQEAAACENDSGIWKSTALAFVEILSENSIEEALSILKAKMERVSNMGISIWYKRIVQDLEAIMAESQPLAPASTAEQAVEAPADDDATVPLTNALLCLISAIQGSRKVFIQESCMAEALGLPVPLDWNTRCKTLFFQTYKEQAGRIGLKMNQQTFEAILRTQVTDEMNRTDFDELPKQYIFDPWAGMGYGGIVKRSGKPS